MELIHVDIAIRILVLKGTHLYPCGGCWSFAIIVVSRLFFILIAVWDNLEIELSCWSNNCCQRYILFELITPFLLAVDYLFLSVYLHVFVYIHLIILGQSKLVNFWSLLCYIGSRLFGPVLFRNDFKLFQFIVLHLFLIIGQRLMGDQWGRLLDWRVINFLLFCHGARF